MYTMRQVTIIITLIVTGPCGSDTTTQIFDATTVGISTLDESIKVNVFPNPANNQINFDFEGWNGNSMQLVILDLAGKIVSTISVNENATTFNKSVDISDLSNGIYSVQIFDNSELKAVSKFVKQ